MTDPKEPIDERRIEALMKRVQDAAPAPATPLSELWPEIRSRIERQRVTPIAAGGDTRAPRTRRPAVITLVAAAAVIVMVLGGRLLMNRAPGPDVGVPDAPALAAVADSVSAYRGEAQALLDRLELERSMLRPEAVSAIDHDLAVVDSAIAEVQAAIDRDPRNPLLQQMLALSFARKVEILKRASNAG